jgi:hypothetical protein
MKAKPLASLALALAASGAAFATGGTPPEPRQICRDIRAEMHELATQENCTSPLNFCAAGTIEGNFGLFGTTFFSVDGAAATAPQTPGTSSYTGIFTITTHFGTLTLRETGISYPRRGNPDGGFIASLAEVQSGTGRYASTTGVLFFHGTNGRGLPNDIAVAGTLCFTWPPPRE